MENFNRASLIFGCSDKFSIAGDSRHNTKLNVDTTFGLHTFHMCPNVSWHIKSHLARRISLGIKYYAILGLKISSSAYATNVDYMFTVINFHISMMVGFFVIINFCSSLSFII